MDTQSSNPEVLQVTLLDGTTSDIVRAESRTSTVTAITAPCGRCDELLKYLEEAEAEGGGVYIFSRFDIDKDRNIYVGEASEVKDRIKDHDRRGTLAEYTRFVVIVGTKNKPITCGKELERRLIGYIGNAGLATLNNRKGAKKKKAFHTDEIDVDRYMKTIRILLPVLGFDILEASGGVEASNDGELNELARSKTRSAVGSRSAKAASDAGRFSGRLFCQNKKGDIKGEIAWKNGRYWLGKGALIRSIDKHEEEVDARKPWIKRRRQESNNLNRDKAGQLKTTAELGFDTLSAAASFIVGASRSSKAFWREHRPKGEESESSQTHAGVHCNSDEQFCRSKKGDIDARIRRTKDGYMLSKGSIIRSIDQDTEVQNASMPWTERRNEEKANLKRDQKGHIITAKDLKFDTLSAAACFVAGRRRSSNQFWQKRESGN